MPTTLMDVICDQSAGCEIIDQFNRGVYANESPESAIVELYDFAREGDLNNFKALLSDRLANRPDLPAIMAKLAAEEEAYREIGVSELGVLDHNHELDQSAGGPISVRDQSIGTHDKGFLGFGKKWSEIRSFDVSCEFNGDTITSLDGSQAYHKDIDGCTIDAISGL